MSRFHSLSALSAAFVLAAGLIAVDGSTPKAAADAEKAAPAGSNQVALQHVDGTVDTMTVLEWTHEIIQTGSATHGGGAGAGKREYKPFAITKTLDKSSPNLLKACATGEHFPKLQLDAYRTNHGRSEPYLTITLENVMVSSFQTSASTSPSASPEEHVTFVFQKITFNYREFGAVFADDMSGD